MAMQKWLEGQQENRPIEEIEAGTLNIYLGFYLISAKKKDGGEYEPTSLNSIFASIKRYLDDKGYKEIIITSDLFKGARDASLWYLTTKCLGMRGRQESRQLKWGDFTRKTDDHGNDYLEFNERTTKTRQGLGDSRSFNPKMWGNYRMPERCPLYLYSEYARHRPYDMREPEAPFYLGINHKRGPTASCWYQRQAMGKNTLGTIVKETAERAGIRGKFTNHSTRRTS